MEIARGEVSGQTAFMEGQFTLKGDMNFLLNMGKLFSN
jgi:putative sterol carrier protein